MKKIPFLSIQICLIGLRFKTSKQKGSKRMNKILNQIFPYIKLFMRKFATPQSKALGKLTQSTHLYSQQSQNREGSLDFSLHSLQDTQYKAAFHIFLQLVKKMVKFQSSGFKQIAESAINKIKIEEKKAKCFKIFERIQRKMMRKGFQGLKIGKKIKDGQKKGVLIIKRIIMRSQKRKQLACFNAIMRNSNSILAGLVRNYERDQQGNYLDESIAKELSKLYSLGIRNQKKYSEQLLDNLGPLLQKLIKKKNRGKPSSMELITECLKNSLYLLQHHEAEKFENISQSKSGNEESSQFQNILNAMDKKLRQIFSQYLNTKNLSSPKNGSSILIQIVEEQTLECDKYKDSSEMKRRGVILKMLTSLLQMGFDKQRTRSSSRLQMENPAGKLGQIFQHILKKHKSDNTNKKMRQLLDFQNKSSKQKTDSIKQTFDEIWKENQNFKKELEYFKSHSNSHESEKQILQKEKQLESCYKKIKQLEEESQSREILSPIRQENHKNIEELSQKCQYLQQQLLKMEEKMGQNSKAIQAKDQEIEKLKKNFRDVSRNHDAKRQKILSLKKQYDRFDRQYSSKKDEEKKSREDLSNLIKNSQEIYKNLGWSPGTFWNSHFEGQAQRKALKMVCEIASKLTNIQKEEKSEIWKELLAISETSLNSTLYKDLQEYIVLFIQRKFKLLRSFDNSSEDNRSQTHSSKGMKKFVRQPRGLKPATPKRIEANLQKQEKTIKR